MRARRHAYNVLKIALMAAFAIPALALICLVVGWPLLLHATFGQPLSVSVAILLVWWASVL